MQQCVCWAQIRHTAAVAADTAVSVRDAESRAFFRLAEFVCFCLSLWEAPILPQYAKNALEPMGSGAFWQFRTLFPAQYRDSHLIWDDAGGSDAG